MAITITPQPQPPAEAELAASLIASSKLDPKFELRESLPLSSWTPPRHPPAALEASWLSVANRLPLQTNVPSSSMSETVKGEDRKCVISSFSSADWTYGLLSLAAYSTLRNARLAPSAEHQWFKYHEQEVHNRSSVNAGIHDLSSGLAMRAKVHLLMDAKISLVTDCSSDSYLSSVLEERETQGMKLQIFAFKLLVWFTETEGSRFTAIVRLTGIPKSELLGGATEENWRVEGGDVEKEQEGQTQGAKEAVTDLKQKVEGEKTTDQASDAGLSLDFRPDDVQDLESKDGDPCFVDGYFLRIR
ncbi:hypothetical protein BT69DRAFT_1296490 [Atractiella rhizophila]|nr:hypothetical protein BT69DRAFT_1296490 [Atractiella rhizophila]